jgi:hypothetical protein
MQVSRELGLDVTVLIIFDRIHDRPGGATHVDHPHITAQAPVQGDYIAL